jgi:ribonuclease P protein component
MTSTLKRAAGKMAAGAATVGVPPAALRQYGASLVTLKKRAEFQRLRGGVKWSGAAFLMEGKARSVSLDGALKIDGARFGFTITKKIGKAHERNRMRRRLSHALRTIAVPGQLSDWDCVIVARRAAHDLPFDDLVRDFKLALVRLARGSIAAPPRRDSVAPKEPGGNA